MRARAQMEAARRSYVVYNGGRSMRRHLEHPGRRTFLQALAGALGTLPLAAAAHGRGAGRTCGPVDDEARRAGHTHYGRRQQRHRAGGRHRERAGGCGRCRARARPSERSAEAVGHGQHRLQHALPSGINRRQRRDGHGRGEDRRAPELEAVDDAGDHSRLGRRQGVSASRESGAAHGGVPCDLRRDDDWGRADRIRPADAGAHRRRSVRALQERERAGGRRRGAARPAPGARLVLRGLDRRHAERTESAAGPRRRPNEDRPGDRGR